MTFTKAILALACLMPGTLVARAAKGDSTLLFMCWKGRQRNVRAALEKISERVGEVDVTASAVVASVQAYSKINTAGQWVDRSEHIDLNALFDKMTAQELEAYAQNGTLPGWFTGTVGATASDDQKE